MMAWRGCGATVTLNPASGNIIGIQQHWHYLVRLIMQISFQRERICVCVYLYIGTKRQIEESVIAALFITAKSWN